MSRSKHCQQTGVRQWTPPPQVRDLKSPLCPEQNVASATECTGLEVRPVIDEAAADSFTDLYAIHKQKPQKDCGKARLHIDPHALQPDER